MFRTLMTAITCCLATSLAGQTVSWTIHHIDNSVGLVTGATAVFLSATAWFLRYPHRNTESYIILAWAVFGFIVGVRSY